MSQFCVGLECINSLAPIYFKNYFTSIHTVHGIGTHQVRKTDLYALRCNTTQYDIRSINYSGICLWNSLPNDIKGLKYLSNFRDRLYYFYTGVDCCSLSCECLYSSQ